jgi:hypothetical protein
VNGNVFAPRYTIGSDLNPGFEIADYPEGNAFGSSLGDVTFPTVFGILIPEPSTVTLGAVGSATLMIARRRRR